MSQFVVVDIGGSGARLGFATKHGITSIRKVSGIDSTYALVAAVMQLTGGRIPDAIALSVPGIISNSSIQYSYFTGWLAGDTVGIISAALKVDRRNVHIVPDGEAHAMALRRHPGVNFGAINIAVGTGVAFGVIDANGNMMRTLSGHNWELSSFALHTRAKDKAVWYALGGTKGFIEQKDRTDRDGLRHYGYRLGAFAVQMAHIFQPKTIGLSGGVIKHYWNAIKDGFIDELGVLNRHKNVMAKPNVIAMNYEETALTGLATIFF